ncbi:hypothetical protein FRC09_002198 [Ceratobasidium sp. 395]|nr:hypothetical protein FRC09_002198 [Ceratobasidium sp. 395]
MACLQIQGGLQEYLTKRNGRLLLRALPAHDDSHMLSRLSTTNLASIKSLLATPCKITERARMVDKLKKEMRHFDATRHRHLVDAFEFDLGKYSFDRAYRTVETPSEIGAESLTGCGTRVCKVQKLDDTGKPLDPLYVLKEVWVCDGRPAEYDFIAEIKESCSAYSRNFLAVPDSGFALAHTGRSSQPDDIKRAICREKDPILVEQVLQPAGTKRRGFSKGKNQATATSGTAERPKKSSGSLHCTATTPQVGSWDYSNMNGSPYRHRRTAFKEIGEPVNCLRGYQDIVAAI